MEGAAVKGSKQLEEERPSGAPCLKAGGGGLEDVCKEKKAGPLERRVHWVGRWEVAVGEFIVCPSEGDEIGWETPLFVGGDSGSAWRWPLRA